MISSCTEKNENGQYHIVGLDQSLHLRGGADMVNSIQCAGAACPVVHFACVMIQKQAKGVAAAIYIYSARAWHAMMLLNTHLKVPA